MADEEAQGQQVQDPPASAVTSGASVSEPYLTKSTAQVDLETRLANDNQSPAARNLGVVGDPNEVNAPYAVEDNDTSGYVGVSPEYMTYANDTEKPLTAEEGVEADALELQRKGIAHAKPEGPKEDNSTAGGGSRQASVYPVTSGENFTSTEVDPAKVQAEQEKANDRAAAKSSQPAKTTAAAKQTDAPKTGQ